MFACSHNVFTALAVISGFFLTSLRTVLSGGPLLGRVSTVDNLSTVD